MGAKLQQITQNPARETKQMRFGMKGYHGSPVLANRLSNTGNIRFRLPY